MQVSISAYEVSSVVQRFQLSISLLTKTTKTELRCCNIFKTNLCNSDMIHTSTNCSKFKDKNNCIFWKRTIMNIGSLNIACLKNLSFLKEKVLSQINFDPAFVFEFFIIFGCIPLDVYRFFFIYQQMHTAQCRLSSCADLSRLIF